MEMKPPISISFFFFSSRRRHTMSTRDWSSDVCSSDLGGLDQLVRARMPLAGLPVDEQRNRHAPGPLPRDAPVGPALNHAADALLAPGGRPLDGANVDRKSVV